MFSFKDFLVEDTLCEEMTPERKTALTKQLHKMYSRKSPLNMTDKEKAEAKAKNQAAEKRGKDLQAKTVKRNAEIVQHNKDQAAKFAAMSPAERKKAAAEADKVADAYSGRRKGSNWTGD